MNERGRAGVAADDGEPGTKNRLVLGAPKNGTRDSGRERMPHAQHL